MKIVAILIFTIIMVFSTTVSYQIGYNLGTAYKEAKHAQSL